MYSDGADLLSEKQAPRAAEQDGDEVPPTRIKSCAGNGKISTVVAQPIPVSSSKAQEVFMAGSRACSSSQHSPGANVIVWRAD